MHEHFIANLEIVVSLARRMKYSGDLGDLIRSPFCALCEFIKLDWPNLAAKASAHQKNFTTHNGFVVIPYRVSEKQALYLSLSLPATVSVEAFDFDNPPADVVYPAEPGVVTKARTLAGAVFDWAKAGFPLATQEQIDARLALCKACDFWEPNVYLNLGKCKKCGCSGAKLNLATSKCPEGKWNAVNNS